MLSYEFRLEISHLSKTDNSNKILCYKKITKNKEFENEEYGSNFYPHRKEKFKSFLVLVCFKVLTYDSFWIIFTF